MKKVTSENVQEYLARYMEGESTQEEQRLLKEYFDGRDDNLKAFENVSLISATYTAGYDYE